MEKKAVSRIQNVLSSTDRNEPGDFEAEFDFEKRRVSYNDKFADHYGEELGFITGILDMIIQINEFGEWENMDRGGLAWVILEARDKVEKLMANL